MRLDGAVANFSDLPDASLVMRKRGGDRVIAAAGSL
jgi:hypothetical protein